MCLPGLLFTAVVTTLFPQVELARPQRAAEAVLDDDHNGENEDILAEILGDLF
jgi:hypothetical protein